MKRSTRRCFLYAISALAYWQTCTAEGGDALNCIGEDGAAVDWWLALKAPGVDWLGNTKYGYIDSTSKDGATYKWREGAHISGTSQNPPADTLRPLFEGNANTTGYVMWNDEPGSSHCPKGCTTFVLGHSKGVLGFSASGGFLLSHSVPKYPDSPAEAQFSGIRLGQLLNGQHFLCVSLNPGALEQLASALHTANLNIYSPHSLAGNLSLAYPSLERLIRSALPPRGPVKKKAATASIEVYTLGGQLLNIFAKSSTGPAGDALRMWEDIVEPHIGAGMLVQSWPEGRTRDLPSYCGMPESQYESLTVTNVSIPGTPLSWKTRAPRRFHDHSKWAVTSPHAPAKVFCGGDNNRAGPQSFRGGLAICFLDNPLLHSALLEAVTGVQPCSIA